MEAWWASLTALEHICLYLAVPATLILVIQTVLLLVGLGGGGDADADGDFDADADGGFDAGPDGVDDGGMDAGDADDGADGPDAEAGTSPWAGLKLFTLRGVVAFLAIAGWGGLWLLRLGVWTPLALFLAVAMGVWAMVLLALLMRWVLRLQADGTVRPQNAVGLPATVYLTVPARRAGAGKVSVLVQERLSEFDAVTDGEEALPTGAQATVVGVLDEGTLIVR